MTGAAGGVAAADGGGTGAGAGDRAASEDEDALVRVGEVAGGRVWQAAAATLR